MKSEKAEIIRLHEPKKLTGDGNIVASIETINPNVASNWLRCNRLNRPLRRSHVAFLSREMSAGLWQVNGQAIVISEDEDVIDGQHRLHAIIDSGVTIKSLVVYGVAKEAFKTIDTGAVRSGSDALSVWFPGRPLQIVQAVGRAVPWCMAMERGGTRMKEKVANSEIIEYVTKHPSLWKVAERVAGFPREGRLMTFAVSVALYEMLARKDAEDASDFMAELLGGEGEDGKASHVLRTLLEKDRRRLAGRYPQSTRVRMAVKAWNLMRTGRDSVAAPSLIAINTRDAERFTIR